MNGNLSGTLCALFSLAVLPWKEVEGRVEKELALKPAFQQGRTGDSALRAIIKKHYLHKE